MHRGSLSIDRGINAIYRIIRFILLYCKFLPTGSREEPKLIALFITAAVMVTALTACGGGSSESKSDSTSATSADSSSSAVETTAEEAGSHIFTLDTNDGFVMTMEYPDSVDNLSTKIKGDSREALRKEVVSLWLL